MLLGELTKAMADTAKPGRAARTTTGRATPPRAMYMQMLPDQLADAVTANGGLGLAQSLYDVRSRSSS